MPNKYRQFPTTDGMDPRPKKQIVKMPIPPRPKVTPKKKGIFSPVTAAKNIRSRKAALRAALED